MVATMTICTSRLGSPKKKVKPTVTTAPMISATQSRVGTTSSIWFSRARRSLASCSTSATSCW